MCLILIHRILNCVSLTTYKNTEHPDGNSQELILSYGYPFKAINSQSIARYIILFLAMAGIDIAVFTTHSAHSALVSKAKNIGLSKSTWLER